MGLDPKENNPSQKIYKQDNNPKYGTPLVVLNTFIILCLVILGLSYKRDMAKEPDSSQSSTEVIQTHKTEGNRKSEWATPHISKQVKIHILYGDETGGGTLPHCNYAM
ncbi:MAG: hypothetical protein KAJ29_06795 [Alphaproteobacteria bacterium]|nr:hypothetical protein [Alphaproteobacteria bacterium]